MEAPVLDPARATNGASADGSGRPRAALRVAASSAVRSVAGAIAGAIRADGSTEIQAIGPEAVNQAVKAIAVAERHLGGEGISVACNISLADLSLPEGNRTVTRFAMRRSS